MAKTVKIKSEAFGGVGATELSRSVPEDGELFNTGGGLGKIINGELQLFDPGFYFEQNLKSRFPNVRNRTDLERIVYKDLGIDINKVPEYNYGDMMQWYQTTRPHAPGHPFPAINELTRMAENKLDVNEVKKSIEDVGTFSTPEEQAQRDLTAEEAKAISTKGKQGTTPGYKGIYEGKEKLNLNKNAVNHLFDQYHTRDANAQELAYWEGKKVGDLEDTLAKTAIFSGEEADKIRTRMMADGKTYISNQAELEDLARAGGLSEDVLTRVGGETGMMFAPTDVAEAAKEGVSEAPGAPVEGVDGEAVAEDQVGAEETAEGVADEATGATGEDAIIDQVADAVGNPDASEEEILEALDKIKTQQIDPYYKQVISQAQNDVVRQINRTYEDRIRNLQSESYNLAENIRGAQKSLESRGMTFSGEAIRQLGTLSAFAEPTEEALTPAQLGQEGQVPTMTAEQMGIEGAVPLQNRLMSESSRSAFNRTLENIGQQALRSLGTAGVQGLNLPAQATAGQPAQTTGTTQYDYARSLQGAYSGLAGQEGQKTDYQKLFV